MTEATGHWTMWESFRMQTGVQQQHRSYDKPPHRCLPVHFNHWSRLQLATSNTVGNTPRPFAGSSSEWSHLHLQDESLLFCIFAIQRNLFGQKISPVEQHRRIIPKLLRSSIQRRKWTREHFPIDFLLSLILLLWGISLPSSYIVVMVHSVECANGDVPERVSFELLVVAESQFFLLYSVVSLEL